MKRLVLAFCLILLGGCSFALSPTPPASPPSGNCAYQWAYKELPELSAEFQKSIQKLQPEAQAYAFAFGEDCIYENGYADFTAMETDFTVNLYFQGPVDESELGAWIVKVMQAIASLPKEQIVGPRPGRVTIDFHLGGEEKFVTFYIDRYEALPEGLNNVEIYQALQTSQ